MVGMRMRHAKVVQTQCFIHNFPSRYRSVVSHLLPILLLRHRQIHRRQHKHQYPQIHQALLHHQVIRLRPHQKSPNAMNHVVQVDINVLTNSHVLQRVARSVDKSVEIPIAQRKLLARALHHQQINIPLSSFLL